MFLFLFLLFLRCADESILNINATPFNKIHCVYDDGDFKLTLRFLKAYSLSADYKIEYIGVIRIPDEAIFSSKQNDCDIFDLVDENKNIFVNKEDEISKKVSYNFYCNVIGHQMQSTDKKVEKVENKAGFLSTTIDMTKVEFNNIFKNDRNISYIIFVGMDKFKDTVIYRFKYKDIMFVKTHWFLDLEFAMEMFLCANVGLLFVINQAVIIRNKIRNKRDKNE